MLPTHSDPRMGVVVLSFVCAYDAVQGVEVNLTQQWLCIISCRLHNSSQHHSAVLHCSPAVAFPLLYVMHHFA